MTIRLSSTNPAATRNLAPLIQSSTSTIPQLRCRRSRKARPKPVLPPWLTSSTAIPRLVQNCVEPISKLYEEDNEADELNKAEEVLSVEFPADEYAALPLYPGKETLDEPASHIAAQPSSILRRRLDAIGAVWRDHLNTISS